MKTIPFSMFSDYKESSLQALLDSFFVPKNPDVEHFLKENAIPFEDWDNTRNYFVFSDDSELLGYFAVSLHAIEIQPLVQKLSKTQLANIRGLGRSSASAIPCFLIGQLARKGDVSNDKLPGDVLLSEALAVILDIQKSIGGRFIVVDCVDALVPFYERNGFKKIDKTGSLNQMLRYISKKRR